MASASRPLRLVMSAEYVGELLSSSRARGEQTGGNARAASHKAQHAPSGPANDPTHRYGRLTKWRQENLQVVRDTAAQHPSASRAQCGGGKRELSNQAEAARP